MIKQAVIYADPPWHQKVWSAKGEGRSAKNHYPVMSLDDLKALPVPDLAAEDCALILWTTGPHLPQALDLGATWGFIYSTILFTWAKLNKRAAGKIGRTPEDPENWFMGMGYATRANTENCLLFRRGSPKVLSHSVRQFVPAVRRRHSQKPDEVYCRIEQLFAGPYCELFARQTRPGWQSWGNEIESTLEGWT